MNKKILYVTVFVMVNLLICFGIWQIFTNKERQVISLFNWSEYIDPHIIDAYNKQSTRFIIKQSFFSSNELAINKIKAGHQYDIVILSEYAIEQLKNDYLKKVKQDQLQFTQVFQKVQKINQEINKNKIFSEYAIPYFWGKLGFLYKKDKFSALFFANHWKELIKNSDYKISLYNNAFEGIFLGLKVTNGDISGSSEEDIVKAKEMLLNLKRKNNNLSFVTDQLLDNMKISGEERYDISLAYSGDARYLMEQNPNLAYYDFSQEIEDTGKGTNVWIDGLVLPRGSQEEGSYDFINFLLREDNIKKNTLFVGYDSPYWERPNLLPELTTIDEFHDKVYKYDEQCKIKINDAWNEIYSYPKPEDNYLFILSFVIFWMFVVFRFLPKLKLK